MTIRLASLSVDLQREAKGDWVEYPDWPGVAFHVSSKMSQAFHSAHAMMLKRVGVSYRNAPVPAEAMHAELAKLYCRHILHGWRGLDVEYSPEKALEVLSDPGYRPVIAAVGWCADKLSEISPEYVGDDETREPETAATKARRRDC